MVAREKCRTERKRGIRGGMIDGGCMLATSRTCGETMATMNNDVCRLSTDHRP